MTDFLNLLVGVCQALWGIWTLDSGLPPWLDARPDATAISITIAILAGASTLLGNSVVLFLNRVHGMQFALALFVNGLVLVALYAVEAAAVIALGSIFLGGTPPAWLVFRGVMLSSAPLVFGVLALAPYVGPAIARLLQAWSAVILWIIVHALFGGNQWAALAVTLGAWGIMQVASRVIAGPISIVANKAWEKVTGRQLMLTGRDLLSGQPFMPVGHQFAGPEER